MFGNIVGMLRRKKPDESKRSMVIYCYHGEELQMTVIGKCSVEEKGNHTLFTALPKFEYVTDRPITVDGLRTEVVGVAMAGIVPVEPIVMRRGDKIQFDTECTLRVYRGNE
jgi:hypothetical protein